MQRIKLHTNLERGVKEWKGSFSTGSVEWTKELRLVLNQEEDKDDGTFWMDYHNFLQRFHEVDVCFAYKSAYSLNIETYIPPSFSIPFEKIEIQLLEPTWLHISICQKTKRGI